MDLLVADLPRRLGQLPRADVAQKLSELGDVAGPRQPARLRVPPARMIGHVPRSVGDAFGEVRHCGRGEGAAEVALARAGLLCCEPRPCHLAEVWSRAVYGLAVHAEFSVRRRGRRRADENPAVGSSLTAEVHETRPDLPAHVRMALLEHRDVELELQEVLVVCIVQRRRRRVFVGRRLRELPVVEGPLDLPVDIGGLDKRVIFANEQVARRAHPLFDADCPRLQQRPQEIDEPLPRLRFHALLSESHTQPRDVIRAAVRA
mmetsp:Transcript_25252/g.64024  ORF Transcript_25252/g.64024 Transcript_25252/m.64024 type:complete len:261 (-) Transcript_25252:116-898(-)